MNNEWTIVTAFDGHKSCDNYDLSSEEIFKVITALEKYFHIEYDSRRKSAVSPDMVGFSIDINNETFTIGWDIWSGVYIMSHSDAGDVIVEQIYAYLSKE